MKIAASNIGWQAENDHEAWNFLQEQGYTGIEVAPGRVMPVEPYEHIAEAEAFARKLSLDYGLSVVSMQSIWFGRSENLFHSRDEREALLSVTKKAIDFASAMHCPNLVFGCPRQRNMERTGQEDIARHFFLTLGEYAYSHGTVIALEANPPIYQTNFLNETQDVLKWADELAHPGISVNLDLGTMIQNSESIGILAGRAHLLHHVHVSEPYLAPIEYRKLHGKIAGQLATAGYDGFVSLEMKSGDFAVWQASAIYMAEVFGK